MKVEERAKLLHIGVLSLSSLDLGSLTPVSRRSRNILLLELRADRKQVEYRCPPSHKERPFSHNCSMRYPPKGAACALVGSVGCFGS